MCFADWPARPPVALLDAQDRWLRPEMPRDECGKVRFEVYRAFNALRLSEVSAAASRATTQNVTASLTPPETSG